MTDLTEVTDVTEAVAVAHESPELLPDKDFR